MYGQEDKNRYNSLQSEFFERAAGGESRRARTGENRCRVRNCSAVKRDRGWPRPLQA